MTYKPWPKYGTYAGRDPDGLHLVFKFPYGAPYYIDLRTIRREEDVGDWYDHMLGKNWVSQEMAGEMLYDMNEWFFAKQAADAAKAKQAPAPTKRTPTTRASAPYERAKMRPSLRFKILQRDGFKCVLCGRAAADGAKLHVDHKVAIAIGGKTEETNLHSLCQDCNLGKGVLPL